MPASDDITEVRDDTAAGGGMSLVVLLSRSEDLESYRRLWDLVASRGGRCEIIALPSPGDPDAQLLQDAGVPLASVRPIASWDATGFSGSDVEHVIGFVSRVAPDFVLACDADSDFSSRVFEALKISGFRGKFLGIQNDVAPKWAVINRRFGADYWLCFGEHQRSRLRSNLHERSFAVGLPRFDALRADQNRRGGYIVYVPRATPDPETIDTALRRFEAAVRVPLVIPPGAHPHRHRTALPLPPALRDTGGWSTLDYVRNADLVLTLPSIPALEGLCLGKPVVVLPNASLSLFESYPGVADGFSPRAINDALRRIVNQREETGLFMTEVLGGVRVDHAERVYHVLTMLLQNAEYNHAGAPHYEAARVEWITAQTKPSAAEAISSAAA